MAILKQLIFAMLAVLLYCQSPAQKKYALIIGINDYYEVKGVKSKESLNGAVNDARAMRNFLISKFGFKSGNIDTIYNEMATRDQIIDGLKKKLAQCKPGDIMVYYYSGHGVWMKNIHDLKDPVKRGMSQAMLTSDLYNYRDKFKCFLRDVTLKTYFNYFIDKKVILTSIFDCCYSGNLAMADPSAKKSRSLDFNSLLFRLTQETGNPQKIIDSISENSITTPAGCTVDSAGKVLDTLDSDGDGVADCKDREKITDPQCMPVNADGIGKCAFDFILQKTLNKYDEAEIKNNARFNETAERNFNAREVITISEKDTVARPSDRANSRYLFLSATKDFQKALEFKDSSNTIHGLFTAALLRVFSKNSIDTPAEQVFKKIEADMEGFHLDQNPTRYSDPARLGYNLIGVKVK